MEMSIDCLVGYLYSCRKDGSVIPAPSDISEIDPTAVSKQIASDEPLGEVFINMISVDVPAYSRQHSEKSVRKTLTIPAWLNTAALEINLNISQVLQEALLAKLQAQ